MSEAASPALSTRLPILFIVITLTLDAVGIGLILPVMPRLLQEVGSGDLGHAAIWGGVLSTGFASMQFLFGPVLGNLSDRFGRRPVLLVSLFALTLDYLVLASAQTLWLLVVMHMISGITSATPATAAAFISDISKPEERAARFGLIGAAFGFGFVLGPVLGGLLAEFGTRAPFYAAAALAALNLCFGLFVMPETVSAARRRPFRWARANPLGAFLQVKALEGTSRLLLLFFLYEFAFIVYPATWAYFTVARFGWDPAMIGVSLGSFGVAMVIVQGGLIRVILRRLGEVNTVLYGFSFNALAFFMLATVNSPTLALILTPLTALGAVVTPALQSMMARKAGTDAQGEMQGVIASVKSLAMIVSPLVMTQVFAFFTAPIAPIHLPGAAFLLSMSLMIVCAAIYITGLRNLRPIL